MKREFVKETRTALNPNFVWSEEEKAKAVANVRKFNCSRWDSKYN